MTAIIEDTDNANWLLVVQRWRSETQGIPTDMELAQRRGRKPGDVLPPAPDDKAAPQEPAP